MKPKILIILLSGFIIPGKEVLAQNIYESSIKNEMNGMAFKLLPKLATQSNENNFVFSSFSLVSALSMVYVGAEGDTKKELEHLICVDAQREKFIGEFHNLLLNINDSNGRKTLHFSNSLWIEEGYKILPSFADNLKTSFWAAPYTFQSKTPAQANRSRLLVNKFIEKESDGQLKNALPENVLNPLTRLLLINVLSFDAKWKHTFETENTKEDDFFLYNAGTVKTKFMNQTSTMGYYEDTIVQAVSIPYNNPHFSMLIILPANKTAMKKIQGSLSQASLDILLNGLHGQNVKLSIPRFKAESGFEMKEALKSLGMTRSFGDSADFSSITGNKELYISNIFQKTIIDVNEKETKAASSTIVVMQLKSVAYPMEPVTFKANKPFIYFIMDNSTQTILFIGIYKRPV